MSNIFQDRFGNRLPHDDGLVAVCTHVDRQAQGDPELTVRTLEGLISQAKAPHSDFRAVNNHILRAIIDCVVLGDDIARNVVTPLGKLSSAIHQDIEGGEGFVAVNLRQASAPSLQRLRAQLRTIYHDPEEVALRIAKDIRFSQFPARELRGEHPLVEDTLSRVTVLVMEILPDNKALINLLAHVAYGFRSVSGGSLRLPKPDEKTREAIETRTEKTHGAFGRLAVLADSVVDAAERREEYNDLRLLRPLAAGLRELSTVLNVKEPWGPFPFFLRNETLDVLGRLTDPALKKSFKNISGVLDEWDGLYTVLDTPTIFSLDTIVDFILTASDAPPDLSTLDVTREDLEILPATTQLLRLLKLGYLED